MANKKGAEHYLGRMREKDQVAKVLLEAVNDGIYEPFEAERRNVAAAMQDVYKALALIGHRYIDEQASEDDVNNMAAKSKEIFAGLGFGELGKDIDAYIAIIKSLRNGIDSDEKLREARERERNVSDLSDHLRSYV